MKRNTNNLQFEAKNTKKFNVERIDKIEKDIDDIEETLKDLEKEIGKTYLNVKKLREDFLEDYNKKFPAKEKNINEINDYLNNYSKIHFKSINKKTLEGWVINLIKHRNLKQEKIEINQIIKVLKKNINCEKGDTIIIKKKDFKTIKNLNNLEEEKQTEKAISVFNTDLYSEKKATYNEQQQKTITSAIYKTCNNNGKHQSFKKINEKIKDFIKKDVDQLSICAKVFLLCKQAGIKNLDELKAVPEILFSNKEQIQQVLVMLQASEKELNDFLCQKDDHASQTSYAFSMTTPQNYEEDYNMDDTLLGQEISSRDLSGKDSFLDPQDN